jgi:hypothetical protein
MKIPAHLSVPFGLEPTSTSVDYEQFGGKSKSAKQSTVSSGVDIDDLFKVDTELCADDTCDDLIYQALVLKMAEPELRLEHTDMDELMRAIREEFDNATSPWQVALTEMELPSQRTEPPVAPPVAMRVSKRKGTRRGEPRRSIMMRKTSKRGRSINA